LKKRIKYRELIFVGEWAVSHEGYSFDIKARSARGCRQTALEGEK